MARGIDKTAMRLGSAPWVRRHRVDDTVAQALKPILRAELVVVDDIGLLPVSSGAAEGLYTLVDAAYGRRSVAVSSTCTSQASTS